MEYTLLLLFRCYFFFLVHVYVFMAFLNNDNPSTAQYLVTQDA